MKTLALNDHKLSKMYQMVTPHRSYYRGNHPCWYKNQSDKNNIYEWESHYCQY